MSGTFAFEELEVWQRAVAFADRVIELAENLDTAQKHYRLIDQLEAAVTSVPMNIAKISQQSSVQGPESRVWKSNGNILTAKLCSLITALSYELTAFTFILALSLQRRAMSQIRPLTGRENGCRIMDGRSGGLVASLPWV